MPCWAFPDVIALVEGDDVGKMDAVINQIPRSMASSIGSRKLCAGRERRETLINPQPCHFERSRIACSRAILRSRETCFLHLPDQIRVSGARAGQLIPDPA